MAQIARNFMDEPDLSKEEGIYDYIHFKTEYQCKIFIINNPKLNIRYTCCGGKGLAYPKSNPTLNYGKKEKEKEKEVPKPKEKEKGTCDICFLDGVALERKCNTCTQPFCESCLSKIVSKICPYCRGTLR